ncbi:helix-turn-helix domain-containing protein [Sphingomonas segetis]|jgi:transcriptional regulator with XRE-family HTH domain|uniref:helix-turn-helix transcriptional regulator n=1 Tax=Sphingomonas segetis TaxID=1104779 RepID=UPI0012D3695D
MASTTVATAAKSAPGLNVIALRPDNRIREMRQLAGLTLEQLSDLTGIRPQLLHRLENERDCPKLKFDRVRLIARALGCRFVDLVAHEDLCPVAR